MLAAYDEVMAIMLPTLREERQQTYSPFLPISPITGVVLQVPIVERKLDAGTIVFRDPDDGDRLTEVPVTGGHVKCQWKADWALRWAALGVDYEMSGKDLIDSVKLSSQICKALGGTPPEGFNYELFLDEKGQKISKSKGNGLTIEEWLTYASPESLSLYMFQRPKAAKRLYFDVIPKAVDEYFTFLDAYPRQPDDQQLGNPVWHIHSGNPPDDRHADQLHACCSIWPAPRTRTSKRRAVGLHPPPRQGRDAGDAIRSSTSSSAMRSATTRTSSSRRRSSATRTRSSARRSSALDAEARDAAAGCRCARPIQNAVLDVARAIPRYQDPERKGPDGGPGVSRRLVLDALPDPARPGARAALRLVRGDLRHPGDARR